MTDPTQSTDTTNKTTTVARNDAPHPTATTTHRDRPAPTRPAPTPNDPSHIADDARNAAEQMLVGAFAQAGGAIHDVLQGGATTESAQDVLDTVARVDVATGPTGGTIRTRPGDPGGTHIGIQDLQRYAANEDREGTEIREVRVPGVVHIEDSADDPADPDFPTDTVVRMIRARSSLIRTCYEHQLAGNRQLAGKVTVGFDVQPIGSLSGVRAVENTTGSDPSPRAS